MPLFWILVAAMVLAALAILVLPLVRRTTAGSVARDQLNLAIHRERLADLKQLRDEGDLDAAEYDQAVLDLEQDLADDLQVHPDQAIGQARHRWAALAVAVAVPVLSVGLYLELGSSGQIPEFQGMAAAPAAGESSPSVDKMVAALEKKLKEDPSQVDGWFMLGRSYLVLKRYPEAAQALRRANALQAGEPNIMVSLAQAVALAGDGDFTGEPEQLVAQVLQQEPDNAQALFLAGIASFQQGEMEQAIGRWRKVLALQPPQSEDAKLLQSYIDKASQNLAQQGKPVTEMAAAPEAAAASAAPAAAVDAGASLTVQVSLAPELAAKVKPTDTVFVFAVAVNGPRMPLAIQRLTAAELPASVTLDDSMAMMPAARLSGYPEVTVGARVSFSGDAIAKSGDLEGRVSPVAVAEAKNAIPVVISTPVP